MSILRYWHSFWKLSAARRAFVLEAVFWLALARIEILCVPFPVIARRIGRLTPPGSVVDSAVDRDTVGAISWAINRAAVLLPVRMVCLPRALAAWRMLHRRGIPVRIHFGAARGPDGKTLRTHAWVDAAGHEVTGYPEARDFVEIAVLAQ